MAIQKFTWENGTASNPVPLTLTLMNKLIAAGNNDDIETSVKGYYKEINDRSVVKSVVWSLEKTFPDLHFIGKTMDDTFTIATGTRRFDEGDSIRIIASGINLEYLKLACVFESIDINPEDEAIIDENTIKSRFKIEDGNLVVDAPLENATWSVSLRIKACPIYEDIDTTTNYRLTGQNADGIFPSEDAGLIICNAIKVSGVKISAPSKVSTNSLTYIEKTAVPTTSTKLSSLSYTYAVAPPTAGSVTQNYFRAGGTTGTAKIVAIPSLYDNTLPLSNELTINIVEAGEVTIRFDTNVTSCSGKVLNPSDCGMTNTTNEDNTITWIRKNSHCYVGKYSTSKGMEIKQLWDKDRHYYYDPDAEDGQGELAPIDGTPDENGVIADVFMRLPEFYYRTVNEVDAMNEETGVIAMSFATGKLNDDYIRWDPNTLIGVYEGAVIISETDTKPRLYSISGVTPKNSYSLTNFRTAATNKNTLGIEDNFSLVTYEAHVVMALLYYCYYGAVSVSCRDVVGYGTSKYPKTTGLTDTLGMADGSNSSINFWGLENWWGDLYEWVDNLYTINTEKLVGIRDVRTRSLVRQVQCASNSRFKSFIFGPNADLLVSDSTSLGAGLGWSDDFVVGSAASCVAARGGYGADVGGGVGCLYIHFGPSAAAPASGSRLLYNGRVTEVSDF